MKLHDQIPLKAETQDGQLWAFRVGGGKKGDHTLPIAERIRKAFRVDALDAWPVRRKVHKN